MEEQAQPFALRDIYEHPFVQDLIRENRELRELATKPQVKDLREIPLPYTVENCILIKEGVHNGVYYPAEELKKAVDQHEGLQIYLDHKDTKGEAAQTWVGAVHNPKWSERDKAISGDIDIVDPKTAMAIAYGAKFGLSATVDVDSQEENGRLTGRNLLFKSYSIVVNPAVRETMLNSLQELDGPPSLPTPSNIRCTSLEDGYAKVEWDKVEAAPLCGDAGAENEYKYARYNVWKIDGTSILSFSNRADNSFEFDDETPGNSFVVLVQAIPSAPYHSCAPSDFAKIRIKIPGSKTIGGICKKLSGDWAFEGVISQEEFNKMVEELDYVADLQPALSKLDDAIRRASSMKDTSLLTTLQQIKAIVSKVCGKEYPYPKPGSMSLDALSEQISALAQAIKDLQSSSEPSSTNDNEELEAVKKENEELKEKLNAIQQKEHEQNVERVLKKEIEVGLTAAADAESRRKELLEMDSAALTAVEQNLDRTIKILETNVDDTKPAETTPSSSSQELSQKSSSSSEKLLQMMIAEQNRATFKYGGDE